MNDRAAAERAPVAVPDDVIRFWFDDLGYNDWFCKSPTLDGHIREDFGATLAAAARCELWRWRETPTGRLAEIISLDQFTRNIFRDTARAFENDALALALAQEAVAQGADKSLPPMQRAFAYMPYMHSESLAIHERALRLFDQPGLEKEYGIEQRHLEILERFGRYPHRNTLLGRTNTPDEAAFLKQPGSTF